MLARRSNTPHTTPPHSEAPSSVSVTSHRMAVCITRGVTGCLCGVRARLSFNAATTAEQLAEGEGALSTGDGKKHEDDFALWKSSKPGEPAWDSPWGGGRPGWHIECSVMASEVLGDTLDIHGGGIDLCFPHHDNELAQAEAYYGHQQWVNYFLHSGHLYIGNQKMSKSLKNFFTIRELLKGGSTMKLSEEESVVLPPYTARQLRLVFMMMEWDKPMYFSKDALDIAVGKEKSFKEFFGAVRALARDDVQSVASTPQAWTPKDVALSKRIDETQGQVSAALCDNFNTPTALLRMQDLVTACNVYMNSGLEDGAPKFLLINKAALYIAKIFRILGIDDNGADFPFLSSSGAGGDEETLAKTLDAFCALRDQVRASARSKADAQWFRDKAAQVETETMATLRAEAVAKESVLPKVLAAMEEWVSKVGLAAAGGKEASTYLDLCDSVRDDVLPALGVRLEDKAEGYIWKLDDPEVLARERTAKLAAAAEAARKKLENKLDKTRKELDKWAALNVAPEDMFKAATDKYSKFDEQGIPTHSAAGEELSKKKRQVWVLGFRV
jgi:cysteinyl-tRNA synthetase